MGIIETINCSYKFLSVCFLLLSKYELSIFWTFQVYVLIQLLLRRSRNKYIKFVIIYLVKELQKFVPEVTAADIRRGPAGVRAQAMNLAGELVGDFVFDSGPQNDLSANSVQKRVIHCRNAPSPGATSSLAIGRMMADMMEEKLGLSKKGNAILY